MKYHTIIFDLDGTLLDTLDDLTDSINEMLKQEGHPLRTKEEVREFVGNGAKNLISRALPEGCGEQEATHCLAIYREIYKKNMFDKTRPYEGIPEVLQALKEKGIRIGVVSNKPNDATTEMCHIYFGSLLDAVTGDSPERKKKPAPDNIYAVMEQLSALKETTLYVGDSDVDMITAKNAGLACVGVTWGFRPKELLQEHGPDWIIDNAHQLIEIIL